MKLEKVINLPKWTVSEKDKSIHFWEQRNIKFKEITDILLKGRRGSILGNLISFDMKNIMTKLTITRVNESRISCIFEINTIFQNITDWNKAFWKLELVTYESYLLKNDMKELLWSRYYEAAKKADKDLLISAALGQLNDGKNWDSIEEDVKEMD